jgi:hypothetical protein
MKRIPLFVLVLFICVLAKATPQAAAQIHTPRAFFRALHRLRQKRLAVSPKRRSAP